MSVATPRKHADIPEEIITRLRRIVIGLLTIGLAIGAGWLGLILSAHVGKILLTAGAIGLLWVLAVSVADFFRSS